jgi:hypothetical protein
VRLDQRGNVIGGATCNLFVVSNGSVATPPTESRALPGSSALACCGRERSSRPRYASSIIARRAADELFVEPLASGRGHSPRRCAATGWLHPAHLACVRGCDAVGNVADRHRAVYGGSLDGQDAGLRDEAAEATAGGKHKRALAAYLELERLEPRDAQWAKRAGETYRRLGNNKNAIEAFNRSADRYAQNGFLVQAIAVCKLVLQIDPQHAATLRRLAQMNEQIGMGPTRAQGFAANNPGLYESPNVAAIRRAAPPASPVRVSDEEAARVPRPRTRTQTPVISRTKTSTPQIVAVPRTKSKPVSLPEGAALETVQLSTQVPEAALREKSTPGIHLIPIDDGYEGLSLLDDERPSGPVIEVVAGPGSDRAELDDLTDSTRRHRGFARRPRAAAAAHALAARRCSRAFPRKRSSRWSST